METVCVYVAGKGRPELAAPPNLASLKRPLLLVIIVPAGSSAPIGPTWCDETIVLSQPAGAPGLGDAALEETLRRSGARRRILLVDREQACAVALGRRAWDEVVEFVTSAPEGAAPLPPQPEAGGTSVLPAMRATPSAPATSAVAVRVPRLDTLLAAVTEAVSVELKQRGALATAIEAATKAGATDPDLRNARMLGFLNLVERFAAWGSNSEASRLEAERDASREGATAAQVDRMRARGERQIEFLTVIENLVFERRDPGHPDVSAKVEEFKREFPRARPRADKARSWAASKLVKPVAHGSTVKACSHDHRFQTLRRSSEWTLVIDETGSRFGRDDVGGLEGRVVGILTAGESQLPGLPPAAHATGDTPGQLDARVQAVLDDPGTGVFGLRLGALPATSGNLWITGVLEVIRWALRLLPLADRGPTKLAIRIEQRGAFTRTSDWEPLVQLALAELAQAEPALVACLEVGVQIVPKGGHPHLAYADAIAYTWGAKDAASRARLSQSGLHHTCLYEGDAERLRRTWDVLAQGRAISVNEWRDLVAAEGAARDAAGVGALVLSRLGEWCEVDIPLWDRFLAGTLEHLESKAISLASLSAELSWLDSWLPPAKEMPRRIRLAWLTAVLEQENHLGRTADWRTSLGLPFREEIAKLARELSDEAPALACQADLDLAVSATNRLDFSAATAAIVRWADVPPAVPGLRHWGRVRSSLGQHAAFAGRHAEAATQLRVALEAFAQLSDPEIARGEQDQTGCYLAIVTMDAPTAQTADVRSCLEPLVSLDLSEIDRLARSDSPGEKYKHHILLRYLVSAHARPTERAAYTSAQRGWQASDGHPWQMIETYRAVLMGPSSSSEARKRIDSACRISAGLEQGPLARLIGVTIAVAGRALGRAPGVSTADLDALEQELPLARERLAFLARALTCEPVLPVNEVLVRVLPFNFR